MTKSSAIKLSNKLSKEAFVPTGVLNAFTKAKGLGSLAGKSIHKNWMKLPGMARYGIGAIGTVGMPVSAFLGSKTEMEDHISNKAYDDAYNLTQARAGEEWSKMPTWKRYAASALGMQNSMSLQNSLNSPAGGLEYQSIDGVGNKTYT